MNLRDTLVSTRTDVQADIHTYNCVLSKMPFKQLYKLRKRKKYHFLVVHKMDIPNITLKMSF